MQVNTKVKIFDIFDSLLFYGDHFLDFKLNTVKVWKLHVDPHCKSFVNFCNSVVNPPIPKLEAVNREEGMMAQHNK